MEEEAVVEETSSDGEESTQSGTYYDHNKIMRKMRAAMEPEAF